MMIDACFPSQEHCDDIVSQSLWEHFEKKAKASNYVRVLLGEHGFNLNSASFLQTYFSWACYPDVITEKKKKLGCDFYD